MALQTQYDLWQASRKGMPKIKKYPIAA